MDAETLRETFRRDGIVFLDGVLRGSALASFQDQVSRELSRPAIPPESGTPTGVALSDPSTWPKGNARRVIEVVPPGVGEHWRALVPPSTPLVAIGGISLERARFIDPDAQRA